MTGTRGRLRLAAVLAAAAAFAAVWIVVPAPAYPLLVLAVGASELSAWLALLALVAALLVVGDLRGSRLARAVAGLAGITIALSAIPFLEFTRTARRFDAEMRAAFGPGYPPSESGDRAMRRTPLTARELIAGFADGSSRLVPGIGFTPPDAPRLSLDVYQPAGPGLHPALVQVYGGAWRAGGPSANAAFARYFAFRGYVVFAIDYRHAPAWRWPAQLADIRSALAWIRLHGASYGADTSRLALIGRSSGAQLATITAWEPGAGVVRAVVSLYGPVDLTEGWRDPPRPDPLGVRGIEEAFLGGPPDREPAAYRAASPITYAVRPLPPTLLIVAGRDHVVRPAFGVLLQNQLRRTGTRAALLEIPWAEHGFDYVPNGPSGQLALYHIERFLAWTLAGPLRDVRARRSP